MRYPIFTLSAENNDFFYAEYPDDFEKGSFLSVKEDSSSLRIRVDRFSTIPFYYILHRGQLYGSTKMSKLLESLPNTFSRKLNTIAAIEFLRTNSMIGNKTLLEGVERIPFGNELVFDKEKSKILINEYWKLPGEVQQYNEKELVGILRDSFVKVICESVKPFDKIGMHLSGGMDSRQIFGTLIKEKVDFQTFTYGISENIDVQIAKKLAYSSQIKHHYYKWDGVKSFKENADLHFELTDGMQALIHGHGIEIHKEQSKYVDSILYGHFLDFFIQAHIYNDFFENDHGLLTTQKLYETFDGGPCSIMRGDSLEPLMFTKEYQGAYRESIFKEIKKLDYMVPEKRYDALYLIHHGLRRLMPQVQSGAQYLDFRLPALDRDFFEITWSIPGGLRKDRRLQEKLLNALNLKMMNIPIVKDNVQIQYMGENILRRYLDKLNRFSRKPYIGILPQYYDYYGENLLKMANLNLYEWLKNEVLDAGIEEFDFINPAYLKFLFKDDQFNAITSIGPYSALFTLSMFIKRFIKNQ